jgi:1-acyl-sn-glycerol-3-phosphate acyltransferase
MAMRSFHVWFARICRFAYYSRVTVLGVEHLPATGPALYVALHRNGAVDGLVYAPVVPRADFLISTQWRKSVLGRMFFPGIEVVRDKDGGERGRNAAALDECVRRLEGGGELIVLPEGSSNLGPRHLRFRHGAARIAAAALGGGVALKVVPLGVHYEAAWAFRSRVEVVVGGPLDLGLEPAWTETERIESLHDRITVALESVGVQFESAQQQAQAERLAYVATLATPRSYFASLQRLQAGIPARVRAAGEALDRTLDHRFVLRHQGVPLCPMGPWVVYAALLLLMTPLVAAAALINAVPLTVAFLAGRFVADGKNVIALWRLLAGLPAFVLWWGASIVAAAAFDASTWLGACALLSLVGLFCWYRYKKLAVATLNGALNPGLRQPMLRFRALLLEELDRVWP